MEYEEPYDDYNFHEPRHSGLGIASFVMSLATGLGYSFSS